MSEYWKSIPKKFCEVCKVWFQDNKASVEHHEKGLRHKANVQKRLDEVRKKGAVQLKEQKDHNMAIMQIEAAAMSSFHRDIASDPSLANQMATSSSALNHLPTITVKNASASLPQKGRFGEDIIPEEESRELVRGREKALDTITKKLEKKNKWLEARTAEGEVYYWNRQSMETVRDKPKDGFVTLSEQEANGMRSASSLLPGNSSSVSTDSCPQYSPYGQWKPVENTALQMPDLQLPDNDSSDQNNEPPSLCQDAQQQQEEIVFEEKVIQKKISSGNESFKKRQVKSETKRNVRRRESSP